MYKTMYELTLYLEQYSSIENLKAHITTFESIKKYAIILHDKDGKKPHYHVALHFGRGFDSEQLKTMFNIKDNLISRVKGKWSDVVSYLTHANAPDKYQYPDSEVVANFDFVIDREIGLRNKKINEMILKYQAKEIGYYKLFENMTEQEKQQYYKKIETATKIRNININISENKEVEEMNVYYITGQPGAGKTSFAKFYAKQVKKWDYFVSSSSNDPLDGYMGQECIILDDLRADFFSFADLLKLLDNHTRSSVKSRYYNKSIDCKAIIITSTKKIDELYDIDSLQENFKQLLRRITSFIEIKKDGSIYEFTPDQEHFDKYNNIQPENYIKQAYNFKQLVKLMGFANKTREYISDAEKLILEMISNDDLEN